MRVLFVKSRGWFGPSHGGTHVKRGPYQDIDGGAVRPSDASENIRRGRNAMDRVIREHTDQPHAMYRDGHGWVSFYWGVVGNPKKGFAGGSGIAKIIAKRTAEGANGEDVARKMVEVIAIGKDGPVYGPKGGERFNVSYDGHTAILSLHRFGKEETWLLTGWDDVVSDGAEAGNATGTYATDPSGIRDKPGADSASTIPNQSDKSTLGKAFGPVLFVVAR